MLVYGSYIHRGPKSGCKMVTLFDSYSYDGVSAGIWVIHTYIHVCLYKFELTVDSSPSLPNHCLWYDKLWGPSQRVVTLFSLNATTYGYYTLPSFGFAVLKYVAACDQTLDFSSSVVRVGEYDLSKEKDCFDFPPDDCADEVQVQFSSPSSLSL